jgi:hypothetical protein
MMKANNIAPNAASIKPAPALRAPNFEGCESVPTSKKRKTKGFQEDASAADDDEEFGNIQLDPASAPEKFRVKPEAAESGQLRVSDWNFAENLLQYYPQTAANPNASPAYEEYGTGRVAQPQTSGSTYGFGAALKSENYENNNNDYNFASSDYAAPGYRTPGYSNPIGAIFNLKNYEGDKWDGSKWTSDSGIIGVTRDSSNSCMSNLSINEDQSKNNLYRSFKEYASSNQSLSNTSQDQ